MSPTMDASEVDQLVRQLATGFDMLQEEYKKLHGRHQALEKKLATAREQYNKIAKLYGASQTSTPPLSLSSAHGHHQEDALGQATTSNVSDQNLEFSSAESASKITAAIGAVSLLRNGLPSSPEGVKIWSGPLADKHEGSSCMMPSIIESPLERDFTVEGKPSKLGCPFASMSKKKLSSHAASVLSRYNQSGSGAHGSVGGGSTAFSNSSRVNGLETLMRRQSRRTSLADPIKAEICGLSDHRQPEQSAEEVNKAPTAKPENADVGVCPIRFLDQHSPEEVATYFEKHKHELPRNHEVCVMRYQSNEEQIRELDAKYGNLVSMIQGLGMKHKDMLPHDPDDGIDDGLSDAKVRKWASSVSAQAPDIDVEVASEERQPHFERPLREIRVGESPSRPWGISVPAKYLDKAPSDTSSRPAHISGPAASESPREQSSENPPAARPAAKCPFGHGASKSTPNPHQQDEVPAPAAEDEQKAPAPRPANQYADDPTQAHLLSTPDDEDAGQDQVPRMVFTGPVFIGYSPEDAAKILSGLRTK